MLATNDNAQVSTVRIKDRRVRLPEEFTVPGEWLCVALHPHAWMAIFHEPEWVKIAATITASERADHSPVAKAVKRLLVDDMVRQEVREDYTIELPESLIRISKIEDVALMDVSDQRILLKRIWIAG